MRAMKIIVVTPTLGESRWLDEAVASVAIHPEIHAHVLVAPRALSKELAARFPAARVIAEPDSASGMYAAINAGLAAATDWDAFTYLNDDDVLLPAFAANVRAMVAAHAGPLICYGSVRLIGADGRRLGAIPISPLPSLNRALYAERLEPVYQHGTLVSRDAWVRLGGFDETFRYCGDSEFFARACVTGVPFIRVRGGEVAAFRLRVGQLTKNRPAMVAERASVDEKFALRIGSGNWSGGWARAVFRLANAPVYAERFARHGLVSFDELLMSKE